MYTMKQVAKKMNLSVHTLRFYANEDLFPYITRDKNNIRYFSEDDLNWVHIVQCLRDTGMPLSEVKNYIELCKKGDSTIKERYHLITAQKEKAEAELEEMKKKIEILAWKSNNYKKCLEGNTPDYCNPKSKSQTMDDISNVQ